jgi:hypothetical protein
MLAFKVAFFVLVAAPFISSAPSTANPKIDCYISYLKSKNLFSEAYSPSPLAVNLIDCDEIVHEYHSISEKTYNDMFARNKETEAELDCIMSEFLKTEARDKVLLGIVYETKRIEGSMDKDTYCKLSKESKEQTRDLIIQSVDTCIPNSKFGSTFPFETDCIDPNPSVKITTV